MNLFPKNKQCKHSWAKSMLFLLLLLIVAALYGYQQILFKKPQSVHKWRQSDCASLTLNYYQNGMHFFSPETHNLTSDGGTTGKCCTSEIPLLYYTVALLYQIFGYHDFIYRLLNTLLFFLGLFYLFKLFNYLLSDIFWAIGLTLIFFTSPVLVFYGNNYLTNSSALSFSLVGWYLFFRFAKEHSLKHFILSMLVFSLAGSFKVSAFFSLLAIAGVLVFELFKLAKFDGQKQLFNKPVLQLGLLLLAILPVALWIVYAAYYNHLHGCTYFSTTLFPIWSLSSDGIHKVLSNIENIWLAQYFHWSVLLFLGVCLLMLLAFIRKGNKLLNVVLLLVFLEVVAYVLLQFYTFRDHDYYTIDIFILPVLLVLASFIALGKTSPKLFRSFLLKGAFAGLLLFNVLYARQQITDRYQGDWNNYATNNAIYTIEPFLRQIGVMPTDSVISLPDEGHVSLYLMNQKGWTDYTDMQLNRGEKIRYNQDSAGLAKSIERGAKYLVLKGRKELYLKPYLQPFCKNLKGEYADILIFSLNDTITNFKLKPLNVIENLFCNAENRSNDGQSFKGTPDSSLIRGGETQSNEFAHCGKYSVKLNSAAPYGFTVKFENVKVGESFKVTVWRKAANSTWGGIIASASDVLYNNDYTVTENSADGWQKLTKEFFISQPLPNNELAIYAFNDRSEPVYFDDLEVTRFESIGAK
jgi:hypothetical protein